MKTLYAIMFTAFVFNHSFAQNIQADTTAVKEQINKYAESINTGDSSLGSKIFSHSPEVSFISPMGHQHGWNEINSQVYHFFASTFQKRRLIIYNVHVNVYDNVAWAELYWIFDATFRQEAKPIQTRGKETQILEKRK